MPVRWHIWIGLLTAFALTGCALLQSGSPEPQPHTGARAPPITLPSAESMRLARYYRGVQKRLLADGQLRTDGGGSDTPVTARSLAANFERIALFNEYRLTGGRFTQEQTPSILRRWRGPVRIQAHFGASVPREIQDRDRAILGIYATRLARVTGHPIRHVYSGGNFHVLYLNRDEQRTAGPLLRQILPGIGDETIDEIIRLPRSIFCTVHAFSRADDDPVYIAAIAMVRAEHPELLRRSCVHEEVAQGLGLPNDSPVARPSIFNDDEEFALLTRHDELLLRMLYDNRLRPGMRPADAQPIVRRMADALLDGAE
ncbi:MAG: DUF2927 domain-containing protein [Rhodobacteraceae bacterium]|nr:DUF2927 domain-containing protein [Paracoccaceae bacterium]